MRDLLFVDRQEAGRALASGLDKYSEENPAVVAVSCGAIPIAGEIARYLRTHLDLLLIRRIPAPFESSVTIGAVAPGGVLVRDPRFRIGEPAFRRIAAEAAAEFNIWCSSHFGPPALPDVENRTVVLVDDGLMSGLSVLAGVIALRDKQPRRIVVAAPIASQSAVDRLREEVDEIVCVAVREDITSVSSAFIDDEDVDEAEAADVLSRLRRGR